MSGDVLRAAARLMRGRATAANKTAGVWFDKGDMAEAIERADLWDTQDDPWADAEHIASWHPTVALAVADWLEHASESCGLNRSVYVDDSHAAALTVARAYLGETA